MLLPLLFRLYQRAHIAATRGTEYVVYMFQSLAHAETAFRKLTCFEESTFRFREILQRGGYHTSLYIVVYILTD